MDFALSTEQRLLVESLRAFVEQELYPHEAEVERTGELRPELIEAIKTKAMEQGFYAANMPEDLGGGGLDHVSTALLERELGKASFALQYIVARPSNILQACTGEQVARYLLPTVRGERVECLAMSEPGAGSDLRAMTTRAEPDGNGYVINGSKHFISQAEHADFTILFATTGVEESARGPRKRITAFLVDMGTPGFEVRRGPTPVSHRGHHPCQLFFSDCRIGADQVLGEVGQGFEVANTWLGATRIWVAANCVGSSGRPRASSSARPSAASRAPRSSWPTWRPRSPPPSS
jgi:acyl-CoA dehydrogenase